MSKFSKQISILAGVTFLTALWISEIKVNEIRFWGLIITATIIYFLGMIVGSVEESEYKTNNNSTSSQS